MITRSLFTALAASGLLGVSPLAMTAAQAQRTAAPAARTVAPILTTPDAVDDASYAQPRIARVTHVALDLTLDFTNHRVAGTATLDLNAARGARTIVLDAKQLEIQSITDQRGRALPFTLGATDAKGNAPLTVQIGAARKIVVRYQSARDPAALQFLSPEQTAGKQHPYMLSQGQAILNRSWIPTQDSPGIRQTWEAVIRAPEPLTVVMSGDRLTPEGEPAGPGMRAFRFKMDHPVAPYLIAIAAGDIAFRPLGARTGVWTEPAMMDAAVAELADTERMVEAAEQLYGPYRWGRSDMIVLPPSFPYGGMENPTLTFLTPTFIAGDKSLNGLVAHELAHSWSGNLVTNAVWGDGWLNEGFTSYFENRIMEALYGTKRAQQEAALSFDDMESSFNEVGPTSNATRLHQTGEDADPDGGSSGVVYDKGSLFLRTMEHIVGRERWDTWLKSWFDRHAFQPATSAMLVADIEANLIRGDQALADRMMLRQWVYEPGLPSNVLRPDPATFAEVDAAATAFGTGAAPDVAKWNGWTTAERLRYLNRLPRQLSAERLAVIDRDLNMAQQGNNELLFAFYNLALANRYEPVVERATTFLNHVGRRKFVSPLFQTLWDQGDWGRPIARRIYATARPTYHSVTQGTVDRIVGAQ